MAYKKYRYGSSDIHVYIQESKQDIMLVNLPYKVLKPLSQITIPESTGKRIVAKINWSFFTGSGQRLGRAVGYPDVCECQDPDGLLDVTITYNNEVIARDMYGGEHREDKAGFMTSCIIVRDGKVVKELSDGYSSFYSKKNPQTMFGQLSTGNFILAVVEGRNSNDSGLTYEQCSQFMYEMGCQFACMGDGGGSSEMIVDGKIMNYLSDGKERSMTNALCIVQDIEEESTTDDSEQSNDIAFRTVICTKGTLNNGTEYPTRKTIDSDWDRNGYKIKVGDRLIFDDVKPINGKPDCYFQIVGGDRTDLVGRWFAYDKDYFD